MVPKRTFNGWPEEALDFYEGLEADNTKAYWTDHKQIYDDCVRAPMEALLAELAPTFGEGKIFRPYRDVRFSKDKSPYKTAIGATLAKGGYVQLSSNGLSCGSGYWHMESDQLERYRAAVDDDRTGKALAKVVSDLRKAKLEIGGHGELKRAPRGYDPDHPRLELLRYKGITSWRTFPVAAWLGTPKAKDRVIDFFKTAKPLANWLDRHVGPTSAPQR